MAKFKFERNIKRDAAILAAMIDSKSINPMDIAPLLMQREEFSKGPDSIHAYFEWMKDQGPEYRAEVAREMMYG